AITPPLPRPRPPAHVPTQTNSGPLSARLRRFFAVRPSGTKNGTKRRNLNTLLRLVGAPRFELGTPCTPCKCESDFFRCPPNFRRAVRGYISRHSAHLPDFAKAECGIVKQRVDCTSVVPRPTTCIF